MTDDFKTNCLLTFVDLKDPFAPSEVAGEELSGPILSILSARHFESVFLFHTPHTRANALATEAEITRRHPNRRVVSIELDISDPKEYSSVIGTLSGVVETLVRAEKLYEPHIQTYVCASSGTAEMRAAWLFLIFLGLLQAEILQVTSLSRPLFGAANVREMRPGEWRHLVFSAYPAASRPQARTSGWPGLKLGQLRRGDLKPLAKAEEESRPDFCGGEASRFADGRGAVVLGVVLGLDNALQELGIHVGSAVLRHAAERAGIAAGSDLPVLLQGETGTGKERFAHLIHRMSSRCSDFVAVNCAAIPKELAEDYLFGHTKGAYTGATCEHKGMFESANGGTLFLDEIAELTLEVQAKLLRVIQDGVVQRLGSAAPRKVDVRIIAATNRDLRKEVSAGRFREDLYFRLEVVQIKLPPLRERRTEIPELALALLRQINSRRHKPRQLSPDALMCLERYDWPGNVRQLSNVLERSVLYAHGDVIRAEDVLIGEDTSPSSRFVDLPALCPGFKIDEFLSQIREEIFEKALAACNGNQSEAAELLGVSKQAVSKFVASKDDNAN